MVPQTNFVLREDILSVAPPWMERQPQAIVALGDARSHQVTLGLEALDFRVCRTRSGAEVLDVFADVLLGDSTAKPDLLIISSGQDGPDVVLTLRELGWLLPIIVCLDRPDDAPLFWNTGVRTLLDRGAEPARILRAALQLWSDNRPAPVAVSHVRMANDAPINLNAQPYAEVAT